MIFLLVVSTVCFSFPYFSLAQEVSKKPSPETQEMPTTLADLIKQRCRVGCVKVKTLVDEMLNSPALADEAEKAIREAVEEKLGGDEFFINIEQKIMEEVSQGFFSSSYSRLSNDQRTRVDTVLQKFFKNNEDKLENLKKVVTDLAVSLFRRVSSEYKACVKGRVALMCAKSKDNKLFPSEVFEFLTDVTKFVEGNTESPDNLIERLADLFAEKYGAAEELIKGLVLNEVKTNIENVFLADSLAIVSSAKKQILEGVQEVLSNISFLGNINWYLITIANELVQMENANNHVAVIGGSVTIVDPLILGKKRSGEEKDLLRLSELINDFLTISKGEAICDRGQVVLMKNNLQSVLQVIWGRVNRLEELFKNLSEGKGLGWVDVAVVNTEKNRNKINANLATLREMKKEIEQKIKDIKDIDDNKVNDICDFIDNAKKLSDFDLRVLAISDVEVQKLLPSYCMKGNGLMKEKRLKEEAEELLKEAEEALERAKLQKELKEEAEELLKEAEEALKRAKLQKELKEEAEELLKEAEEALKRAKIQEAVNEVSNTPPKQYKRSRGGITMPVVQMP